jgi:hypothetical protein
MRADNHGEGGILARLALVSPRRAKRNTLRAAMVVVGLVGATLFYGDGCITPAISVLSAVEGLKIYAPQLKHAVLPLTVAILLGPFLIQRRGTGFIACPKTGNRAAIAARRAKAAKVDHAPQGLATRAAAPAGLLQASRASRLGWLGDPAGWGEDFQGADNRHCRSYVAIAEMLPIRHSGGRP